MSNPLNLLNTTDAITTITNTVVANQQIEISDVNNLQNQLNTINNATTATQNKENSDVATLSAAIAAKQAKGDTGPQRGAGCPGNSRTYRTAR